MIFFYQNELDEKKTAGVAEFIMQEEFNRFTGYWWSKKKTASGNFRIAYFEVDEKNVPFVKIPKSGMSEDVDEYAYPRAGEANATSVLCTVEFSANGNDVKVKKHNELFEKHFPWCEYVPRAGWTPCSK